MNEIIQIGSQSMSTNLRIVTLLHEQVGRSFGRPLFDRVGSGLFGFGCIYGGQKNNDGVIFRTNFLFGHETLKLAKTAGEEYAKKLIDQAGAWAYYRPGKLEYGSDYPDDPIFIILAQAVGFTLGEVV